MIKVRPYLAEAAPLAWLDSTSEEDIRPGHEVSMSAAW